MENCLGMIFLETVTGENVFGINFAVISGWGVTGFSRLQIKETQAEQKRV